MNADAKATKQMGVLGRIVGVFTSPRETFESVNQKPAWLVPFLIVVVVMIIMQFLAMDIGIKDRLAMMEARDMPAEQYEAARAQMEGPMKYIGIAIMPVAMIVIWGIIAGILLFGGNTIMGGEAKFKNVFSVVAWSSLVGALGAVIKTLLILSKGTSQGVSTSLAVLLPTPEWGQSSVLHRLLSKFDLFTIWELILWIVGLAVVYRFTTKKLATLVLSLWALWIVISVALGGVLGGVFGG